MQIIDGLATKYELSMQAAARRIVEETKQDCALAMSFRVQDTDRFMHPHLYCSRSFEARFRWKATGSAQQTIAHCVGAATHAPFIEPLLLADAAGRGSTIAVDPLRTPRAVLLLFRAMPTKSRRTVAGIASQTRT
jgi:hypothetical protein